MKYLTVELGAIDEIVGNRFLQSTEFEAGKALASILKGQLGHAPISDRVITTPAGDGLFLTSNTLPHNTRYLVIDLETSKMFEGFSDSDALFVFQKLLRFAKKAWQGLAFNFSERFIQNSTKALIFPFRGFKPAPYRITIEREPMSDRLEKRGDKGNFLLAYKSGHEGADSARETAELTNFRKAYEAIAGVRSALRTQEPQGPRTPDVDQLRVAELQSGAFAGGSIYRRYEDWLPLLTTQQRTFVEAPIEGPYRLEGPAGTGKTLSLMLKAVAALRRAETQQEAYHAVFVTHSAATKASIAEFLSVIDGDGFAQRERALSPVSLKLCTLSELCAEQLRQAISETEFIDRDAMESKALQLLYISEAQADAMAADYPTHQRFLSPEFSAMMQSRDEWAITEMLQHEISVIIKGRANETWDAYKKIPALKYGIPVSSEYDKAFIFAIFRRYQAKLGNVGQFDTDDVVLSTIGQLDTPIWRRRRQREGYDGIFIDETHLFNINELHVFHHFTKTEGPFPIVYSVDRSQAVGDRGWTTSEIAASLLNDGDTGSSAKIRTIFRSSVDIVNLAFSIVSSGATLFTNFDNPLDVASSGFTDNEERLTAPPLYLTAPNEEALVEGAFARAEQLHREMDCRRSDILIVTLDEFLLKRLEQFAEERNKPHLLLKRRGDTQAVELARQSSQFVLAHADFVGGLEFFAAVLVGIDEGRVPPETGDQSESSKNYLSYASHNRLYVAVTRAKYRVELLGEKARGPSKILQPAIQSNLLALQDLA